ncbi:ribosomal protein L11 methyltransferase [Desulfohalotomaculum tongense]|uniref:50S ribosomal protein L11 methyltransferase n=1 Tax=Desulforadius tongensis TaxID=1216062 RepID=UPI00195786CF|nr:50S ribosomal protein L11 methyltransferase [Desulforadius tongensis]MBM7855711.1 ribosomal protein L11 methyltransferase [Desulforadius tongensis]
MKWLEAAVHTPPEGVEMVALIFEELGSGGVAIDDPALIYNKMQSGEWDVCEYPEVELKQEMAVVKGYFPLDSGTADLLAELKKRISSVGIEPKIFNREVKEEDWATAWQAYYKPFKVGRKFLIKPYWEKITPEPGRFILELDPGMAFGCGTHPTTSMCLEFIEECIGGGEEVCDVGTGSGILAVAAAKLGAAPVVAVDMDKTAVKVAQKNVRLNGVEDKVQVLQGDLLSGYSRQADVIIANIVADVIIKLAPGAAKALKEKGFLITSGIINHREEEVLAVLRRENFVLEDKKCSGDWRALLLRKK